MNSIRTRLIAILILGTGIVWIYLSTRAEVERVLDARLMEAARMVNSLLTDHRIEMAAAAGAVTDAGPHFRMGGEPYERQLSCQIWSLSGDLVGRSESAPQAELSSASAGFSQTQIDGEAWRVYAVANEALGVRVLVGDSLAVREGLVADVIKGLAAPAAIAMPIMALMIWFSVRQGLMPLSRTAAALARRPADDLRPLETRGAPVELRPPLLALNGLFRRVEAARQRERDFTAFAAHELKTPLAGLKTQAQIALASDDREIHANALRQIVGGVDRTGRLVRQLLDLTAMEAAGPAPALEECDLGDVVRQAVRDIESVAASRGVRIVPPDQAEGPRARIEPGFMALALRNVLENAARHAREGGEVVAHVAADGRAWRIEIGDDGPGMREADIARATERFFRAGQAKGTGSGLGLSIAKVALTRIGGSLEIANRPGGGLGVTLSGPMAEL